MQGQRTTELMRPLAVVAMVASIVAAVLEYWPQETVIPWRSLPDALTEAQAKGVPVYLDLYATWCGPCKEMDRVTFPNDSVREVLSTMFIPARLDIDTRVFSDSLKSAWNIKGVPTSMILSPTGGELRRRVGYQGPSQILAWLLDTTLTTTSAWQGFPEARQRSRALKRPLLVVIAANAERMEEVDSYFADSTMRQFVSRDFEPALLIQNGATGMWIDSLRAVTPVSVVPTYGFLLIVLSPDGRDLGQLAVHEIDFDDAANTRRILGQYVKR